MQNLVNDAPKKRNYDFVDHIRCLAMIAIITEHVITGAWDLPAGSPNAVAYLYATQITKFGTISFFLLAGFLIGDKFTDYKPGEYLRRRFSNTFGPWMFWSILFTLCFIINLRVKAHMYHDDRFNVHNILQGIEMVYLYSNYWFIINFMVSITLLLIFKRYLYNKWFGFILMICTLFYSVNAYTSWINPSHTTAILGYIFFLWMGAQLRKYWHIVELELKKIPYWLLGVLIIITYAASIYEITLLTARHVGDNYNTLRFSNILYTLFVFATLLKIQHFKWLNYLSPRKSTYGLYLIHPIILVYVTPEILRPLHIEQNEISVPAYLAYKLLILIITYGIAFILIKILDNTRAKRLIGN